VKLIEISSGWIHAEVVFIEDFGKMCQVVFTDILVPITEHMVNARR